MDNKLKELFTKDFPRTGKESHTRYVKSFQMSNIEGFFNIEEMIKFLEEEKEKNVKYVTFGASTEKKWLQTFNLFDDENE